MKQRSPRKGLRRAQKSSPQERRQVSMSHVERSRTKRELGKQDRYKKQLCPSPFSCQSLPLIPEKTPKI